MRNKISQVLGISKKSLAEISPTFLSDRDRRKLQNTRKVDAGIGGGGGGEGGNCHVTTALGFTGSFKVVDSCRDFCKVPL